MDHHVKQHVTSPFFHTAALFLARTRPFFVLILLLATGQHLCAQGNSPARPNIIIITTDQQSADAMSAVMGSRWIHTPAMDQLYRQGVVFRKAYAANPLCVPSRNSMITGQFPHVTGVESNSDLIKSGEDKQLDHWTDKDFRSLGTYFKDGGYETAYFGKWHLNYDAKDKKSHGFQTTRFTTGRGDDDSLPGLVERFLQKRHDRPFLLFVSVLNPHDVCEWARFQRLPNGPIGEVPSLEYLPPMKANFLPPKDESDAMTLMRRSYQNNLKLFPVGHYTAADWRRLQWGYYRLVEKADSLIGQMLSSIKENGYDSNTLILFTSDHGDCLGAHQFNQKTVFYEESSRVPFIIRYLGKLKPGINQSLVNTGTDILPTLLDYAHIKIPGSLPGRSLMTASETNTILKNRPFIVAENEMVQGGEVNGVIPVLNGRMVRSDRYKYCLYDIGTHREALFDLKEDPGETVNLAREKSSRSILISHRRYLERFARKYSDTLARKMLSYVH